MVGHLAGEEKKRTLEELERENIQLREDAARLKEKLSEVEGQLKFLTNRMFGRRSERFENPNQLDLLEITGQGEFSPQALENVDESEVDEEPAPKKKQKKRGKGRYGPKPLPDDLPRKRVEIIPPESQRICACCDQPMVPVGETITEELDVEPPKFSVTQLVQIHYACPEHMTGQVSAPLPPRPIDKGRPSASLLAFIVVQKYVDHLPLFRQEGIFKRSAIHLPRSTMNEWLGRLCELLEPIVSAMRRRLIAARFLQSDDTRIQFIDREVKGKTRRGYLWSYGIPFEEVVYVFTTSRAGKHPKAFLADFVGHLQCDGHASYKIVFASGEVIHIACGAHIRRKFFDARSLAPTRVDEILGLFEGLYAIERKADEEGIRGEALVELRRAQAVPRLNALEPKIEELGRLTTPKSALGRAVKYANGQWEAFRRYVEVAEARIDNNWTENTMRPIALNRKNSLFLGSSEGGAKRAEVFFSLAQSCRQLGIEPFEYFGDVISRISTHPPSRIDELTPLSWKAERESNASEKLPR